jgi:hypothetical protein
MHQPKTKTKAFLRSFIKMLICNWGSIKHTLYNIAGILLRYFLPSKSKCIFVNAFGITERKGHIEYYITIKIF